MWRTDARHLKTSSTLLRIFHKLPPQGIIRGEILVNGFPKEQATWSRVVGYVEQMDTHSAQTTVREALLFSARMRLDESVTLEQVGGGRRCVWGGGVGWGEWGVGG